MLRTSMGSWLGARRRKGLRGILLKLFSRDLAFIVISYFCNATVPCGRSPRCSGGIFGGLLRGGNKNDKVPGRGYVFFSLAAPSNSAGDSHVTSFGRGWGTAPEFLA